MEMLVRGSNEMPHRADQLLREWNMKELIGTMCIGVGAEDSGDNELGLGVPIFNISLAIITIIVEYS
jgi:hypothetical protein